MGLSYRIDHKKENGMQRKHNASLTPIARELRKEMTKEERHLWYDFLRAYPVRFRRQKILGNYVADFYCSDAKLVIELDGSQHYEEQGLLADAIRTAFLEQYQLEVLRVPNNAVNQNFHGVCEAIDLAVQRRLAGK